MFRMGWGLAASPSVRRDHVVLGRFGLAEPAACHLGQRGMIRKVESGPSRYSMTCLLQAKNHGVRVFVSASKI